MIASSSRACACSPALPDAARVDDLASGLRDIGIEVSGSPDLMDLVVGLGERLDRVSPAGSGTDFTELARRARPPSRGRLVPCFRGCWSQPPVTCKERCGGLGIPASSRRWHEPTSRACCPEPCATGWTERCQHRSGRGRRFTDLVDRRAFDAALDQYCLEGTRIVREFAAGWYGNSSARGAPGSGPREATRFGSVAFKKIIVELGRKRDETLDTSKYLAKSGH